MTPHAPVKHCWVCRVMSRIGIAWKLGIAWILGIVWKLGMAWAMTLLLTDFHLAPLEVISPVTYLSFQRKRPLIVRLNYHMGTGITWQCYSTLLKIDTWQFNFLTATMKLPHNKEYKTLYPHNHKDSLNFKSSLHCSLLWMGNNMVPYLLLF